MFKKKHILYVCLLTALGTSSATASEHYVSPAAAAGGDGSQGRPFTLQTALSHPAAVKPGDTIWLRGGTYKGRYISTLTGTAQSPIVIRNYPGETPKIDGYYTVTLAAALGSAVGYSEGTITVADGTLIPVGATVGIATEEMRVNAKNGNVLHVSRGWNGTCAGTCPSYLSGSKVTLLGSLLTAQGAHTWYWGFEMLYSAHLTRIATQTGSEPRVGGLDWHTGIVDQCNGCKFINLVLHDIGGNGISSHGASQNSEFYGNIIFHNGWDAPDRGHAHGLYLQNSTGNKRAIDNMIFRMFGYGTQVYGTSNAQLNNISFEGNTFFNNGEPTLAGFSRNILIGGDNVAQNPVLKDNYTYYNTAIVQGENSLAYGAGCANATITGNYFVHSDLALALRCTGVTMTGNTIFGRLWGFTAPTYPANTYLSARPGIPRVFVRPNKYEPGRGFVTVFNWPQSAAVNVDLSAVLSEGDQYEVHDVQNLFGSPVASGVYSGGAVSLPMLSVAVAQPIGRIAKAELHTPPEFGAFVVRRGANDTNRITNVTASSITQNSAVITWTTSAASDSQVEYGTTSGYGTYSPLNTTRILSHTATLTGLAAGVTYNYRVHSRDAGGGLVSSGNLTFRTTGETTLTISGVNQTVSGTTATLTWMTNVASDTQVDYGTTASLGTATPLNAAMVTGHSATISGLTAGSTYYYRVRSKTASGQSAVSAVGTFSVAGPTGGPVISLISATLTDGTLAVMWATNVASDSQINYGTTTALGAASPLNAARVTNHIVTLTNIPAGTTYYYTVQSRDAAGKLTVSPVYTFRAPVLSNITATVVESSATIRWNTDVAADSVVEYWAGSNTQQATVATRVTAHVVSISGLQAGGSYNYRVRSQAANGSIVVSRPLTFAVASTPPPTTTTNSITNVVATAQRNSITFTWTTSISSDTQVAYGATAAYDRASVRDMTMTTSHRMVVADLPANTLYHFAVVSRTSKGTVTHTADADAVVRTLP